jgi:hypothetical protein
LKNEEIFHACPDDLKYFKKYIQDTEDSEIKLLSRNSRTYKTAIRSNKLLRNQMNQSIVKIQLILINLF